MNPGSVTFLILSFSFFFLFMAMYLKIAKHNGILDVPNNRSSHEVQVIRGGGVVFYLSVLAYEILVKFDHLYFFLGLTLIATISFLDDLNPQSRVIRITIHLIAVVLLGFQLDLWTYPWWVQFLVLLVTIGTLNAYNFMDGINGMIGIYSVVTICSLLYVDYMIIPFTSSLMLITIISSILVFGFYNFRKCARCFAGDVGSISMAFVVAYLLLKLIVDTKDTTFILFLSVYGVDSVLTIMHRLRNQENIFQAHRTHLYQYLVNIREFSHLSVAAIYGLIQLLINALVVLNYSYFGFSFAGIAATILIPLTIIYISLKYKIEAQTQSEGVR